MTRAQWLAVVALGAVMSALFWVDPLFVPLALLGPLVIGVLGAVRELPLAWPVAVVVVAGVGAVVSDWIVHRSDVGFHLVLTGLMAGLAALGWFATRAIATRRRRAIA